MVSKEIRMTSVLILRFSIYPTEANLADTSSHSIKTHQSNRNTFHLVYSNIYHSMVKAYSQSIGKAMLNTNTAIDPSQYMINVANATIAATTRAG